ncbi:CocE/NonD family hydrolase [Pleionea sp. CnH1-48]|uniref:CocE/NonD family hydrolase n=1 Tax=Pleionea sp. CnH1-48 TaxID=2954494 RepID=UPI002096EA87|nr:CocE/NonD family hydrolase [Pleionea sp. CnH1-48]MCO7227500.1 CocE/NonD family hydrolase [Pleionea sp. CnH1-48]
MKNIVLFSFTILFSILCQSTANANICFEIPLPPSEHYTFDDSIEVMSYDGTKIAANLFVPKGEVPRAGFPTIIFANSWVLDEHEYLIQAAQFAKKGYQVLSYSSRGWGCSGGEVNVVGDKDMADLSSLVDWLDAYTDADMNNIGISGISYGSGISLMGLAREPRIKTAVAMSTWGSLIDSLYQHETPRLFWGFFLVSSGLITANMDPTIAQNYSNLIFNRNIASTIQWGEERSVKNYVHLINERNAPVYLANNFGDNLFQPNNLLKFYSQLTGPKRLDLRQGTHASGEGFGLVGLDNYTWNKTHKWFDHWLKGEENGITQEAPVNMLTDLTHQTDSFSDWPIPQATTKTYYMESRSWFSHGGLSQSKYKPWWTKTDTIYSGLDTFATTGIPVLSALLDAHLKIPVKTKLSLISPVNGIVFKSSEVSSKMKLRGIPKIKVHVKPSSSKMQLNAYLYDVAPNGTGTLITHGPVTLHNANAGSTQTVEWELVATAYDIPAGHRVAVAIDTFDILYGVPTILPYKVAFKFNRNAQSELQLPIVH